MGDTGKALKLDPKKAGAKGRKARVEAKQSAGVPPMNAPQPAPAASKSP